MKTLYLIFLTVLAGYRAGAQTPLFADAGPDRYWCHDMAASGTDTPALGANPVALGGTPPYTYAWTYRIGQQVYTSQFLDSPFVEHPRVTGTPSSVSLEKTGWGIVMVRDAAGQVAIDSAPVYFQAPVGALGTASQSKNAADTITISAAQASDQFPPYHGFRWYPGSYLVSDTVKHPRCFAPVNMMYTVSYIDSVGCSLCCGDAIILVHPAAVAQTIPAKSSVAYLFPVAQLSITKRTTLPATLRVMDMHGRLVFATVVSGERILLAPPFSLARGAYAYELTEQGGPPVRGLLDVW